MHSFHSHDIELPHNYSSCIISQSRHDQRSPQIDFQELYFLDDEIFKVFTIFTTIADFADEPLPLYDTQFTQSWPFS